MLVAGLTLCSGFASCTEPEEVGPNGGTTNPNKVVDDPEGTVVLSMRDYDNGDIRIDNIYINKESWSGSGCHFVSVGEVSGLGNIETIPTTGWAEQVGVYPGYGYVAYNSYKDTYYRLYVKEYIAGTSGGVIGAEVKYQKPFYGKDETVSLETKNLSFTADGGAETLYFKKTSLIPFTVTSSESWCFPQKVSSYDWSFLSNGVQFLVSPTEESSASTAIVTIETSYGKKTELTVQREGRAFKLQTGTLLFSAHGGSESLSFTSEQSWTAKSDASWLTVSPSSGKGNGTLSVTAQANTSSKSRTGNITLGSGSQSVQIAVTQDGQMDTNGHAYVDLGLPSGLLWATMNVGAAKPEDYGDYFAWGETTTKSTYSWSTYKWCKGSYYDTLTKYNTSSSYGTVDNKTVLDLSDDAARANWGGSWRMPTHAEWTELRGNCTWTWTTQNGVNGRKVTSKSNGNSIFLPAAGYHRNDTSLLNAGTDGRYWSSSLLESYPDYAWSLRFGSGGVDSDYGSGRFVGLGVRPVCRP